MAYSILAYPGHFLPDTPDYDQYFLLHIKLYRQYPGTSGSPDDHHKSHSQYSGKLELHTLCSRDYAFFNKFTDIFCNIHSTALISIDQQ